MLVLKEKFKTVHRWLLCMELCSHRLVRGPMLTHVPIRESTYTGQISIRIYAFQEQ